MRLLYVETTECKNDVVEQRKGIAKEQIEQIVGKALLMPVVEMRHKE
jgi:hypothetical protein